MINEWQKQEIVRLLAAFTARAIDYSDKFPEAGNANADAILAATVKGWTHNQNKLNEQLHQLLEAVRPDEPAAAVDMFRMMLAVYMCVGTLMLETCKRAFEEGTNPDRGLLN